jgi:hypothetical protein
MLTILDAGCWMLDTEDPRFSIQYQESSIQYQSLFSLNRANPARNEKPEKVVIFACNS